MTGESWERTLGDCQVGLRLMFLEHPKQLDSVQIQRITGAIQKRLNDLEVVPRMTVQKTVNAISEAERKVRNTSRGIAKAYRENIFEKVRALSPSEH